MTIERWLRARFGQIVSTGGGEDIRVNCPFCDSINGRADTKHHMYVNLVKPMAHCFRCSWKGHWMSLIISVEGCSYAEALGYIETPPVDIGLFDVLHSPRGLMRAERLTSEPDGFLELFDGGSTSEQGSEECRAVYAYARHRLYDVWNKTGRQFVLDHFGYVPGSNRLWMLIDKAWWQGRSIVTMEPKYLSPPWPRGDSLWNGEALQRYSQITICEGVFSALHVGRQAIALCAKTMGKEQAKRISKAKAREIVIMLDADAVEEPYVMADLLEEAGYTGDIIIYRLDKGDPCDGLAGRQVVYDYTERVHHVLQNV